MNRRVDTVPRHLARYTPQHILTKPAEKPVAPGSAGGDSLTLRGIPAVGRNVTGAIRGTIPHIAGLD